MATYDEMLNKFGRTADANLIPCGHPINAAAGYDSITNELKGSCAWTQIDQADSKAGHEADSGRFGIVPTLAPHRPFPHGHPIQ